MFLSYIHSELGLKSLYHLQGNLQQKVTLVSFFAPLSLWVTAEKMKCSSPPCKVCFLFMYLQGLFPSPKTAVEAAKDRKSCGHWHWQPESFYFLLSPRSQGYTNPPQPPCLHGSSQRVTLKSFPRVNIRYLKLSQYSGFPLDTLGRNGQFVPIQLIFLHNLFDAPTSLH